MPVLIKEHRQMVLELDWVVEVVLEPDGVLLLLVAPVEVVNLQHDVLVDESPYIFGRL